VSPTAETGLRPTSSVQQVESMGAEIRAALLPLLVAVAGDPPSPTRLAQAIGLDKSLASRLVRATRAPSDLDLMHIVPSPSGLRILAELAGKAVPSELVAQLRSASERFALLVDSTAGGRAAIDALISESSRDVRERREHIARQASFKSMSFLLGHFCDVLTTSLFLVPNENRRTIDGIEIHRRIGLRRMRPSTPLALLSLAMPPEEAPPGDATRFETLDGPPGPDGARSYLLPEFSTLPLSELEVVEDSNVTTLVLPGDPNMNLAARVTSAFRIRNGWALNSEERTRELRGYVLHVPAMQVVRDLFIAESLLPGAFPQVSFLLPGPRVATHPPREDGTHHFTEVDLTASIEQLPSAPSAYAVPGVGDQTAAIRYALERSGQAHQRFRGWRWSATYPVPLIEMMWWLKDPRAGSSG